jgi:hypothetical protein
MFMVCAHKVARPYQVKTAIRSACGANETAVTNRLRPSLRHLCRIYRLVAGSDGLLAGRLFLGNSCAKPPSDAISMTYAPDQTPLAVILSDFSGQIVHGNQVDKQIHSLHGQQVCLRELRRWRTNLDSRPMTIRLAVGVQRPRPPRY